MVVAFFLQIITIPLAITIHFKVAYIMTFVVGYYYKVRFSEERNFREKVKWENIVIAGSILGLVARIILDDLELAGVYEALSDLTVQYSKLFLACAIFVITNRLFSSFSWSRISQSNKKKLIVISGYTYEVYLIHEFFVHQEYTSLFDTAISVKLLIVLMSILLMTFILCKLEKLYKI